MWLSDVCIVLKRYADTYLFKCHKMATVGHNCGLWFGLNS